MRATAKYGAVGKITLLSSLVYSGDVILRAGLMLIVLFVFLQLWSVTYGNGGFESIAGFSLRDIVWYLVLTETVVMSAPRVSTKIDQEVKSGELAYVLLRPYSYVAYHLAAYWGEAVLRLPLVLGVGAAVALPSVGMPAISLPALSATATALLLSLTLNFMVEAAIGLLAFWFEDTQAFFWIYQKLVFTIGGMFLPLELFPKALATVSRVLPFAAVTYTPGRLFVGFSLDTFLGLLALQLFWLVALASLLALIYTRAVRKVSIHGG